MLWVFLLLQFLIPADPELMPHDAVGMLSERPRRSSGYRFELDPQWATRPIDTARLEVDSHRRRFPKARRRKPDLSIAFDLDAVSALPAATVGMLLTPQGSWLPGGGMLGDQMAADGSITFMTSVDLASQTANRDGSYDSAAATRLPTPPPVTMLGQIRGGIGNLSLRYDPPADSAAPTLPRGLNLPGAGNPPPSGNSPPGATANPPGSGTTSPEPASLAPFIMGALFLLKRRPSR